MAWPKRPTLHFEYSWKRTRILIGATLAAVMLWHVAVLPLLRYLEANTTWFSAGISKNLGYYSFHASYEEVLLFMAALAIAVVSVRAEPEHRASSGPVLFAVLIGLIANFVTSPFEGLRFVLVMAMSLVPVIFLASCVVIRGMNRLVGGLLLWSYVAGLGWLAVTVFSEEEVEQNFLSYVMREAVDQVNFSHYYAKRAPEKSYEYSVLALADAPQVRELGDWQKQFVDEKSSWGGLMDVGANEDFLNLVYRGLGDGERTPAQIFDLANRDPDEDAGDEYKLSDQTLRDAWMVEMAKMGIVKNAYLVTDKQIVRCLARVAPLADSQPEVVFVAGIPEPDVRLETTILQCFDGQDVRRFVEDASASRLTDVLSSPCMPLHGFSNYSLDSSDALLAFITRLWASDVVDWKEAAKHFVLHSLAEEHGAEVFEKLATASFHDASGDKLASQKALGNVLNLLESVALKDVENADKRAFLEALFASYRARVAGDASQASEHDAACLTHRARWYESDPQTGVLARTKVASDSVATFGSPSLIKSLGLASEAQKDLSKDWSEDGFWLRKLVHDRAMIEQASVHFGTILDSFVSARNAQAEREQVRKMFAKSPDAAFYELLENGMDITRYFLGSTHNGWCRYRLVMAYGDAADGKKTAALRSQPRYCRVDDVLMSFDSEGRPAKTWDATGLAFHAPAVVGDAARLRGFGPAHRAHRTKDDERDALLGLFMDQLTAGELKDVDALNLDFHPGAHSFDDDQRAVMERMRRGGEDVH